MYVEDIQTWLNDRCSDVFLTCIAAVLDNQMVSVFVEQLIVNYEDSVYKLILVLESFVYLSANVS